MFIVDIMDLFQIAGSLITKLKISMQVLSTGVLKMVQFSILLSSIMLLKMVGLVEPYIGIISLVM